MALCLPLRRGPWSSPGFDPRTKVEANQTRALYRRIGRNLKYSKKSRNCVEETGGKKKRRGEKARGRGREAGPYADARKNPVFLVGVVEKTVFAVTGIIVE